MVAKLQRLAVHYSEGLRAVTEPVALGHTVSVPILEIKMNYMPEHAAQALAILVRLSPFVTPREEYFELMAILRDADRWKEAHALLRKIRVNITLPSDEQKKQDLDAYFVYVAENAAKTAYNCSGCPAPFDEDSFEWLLKCEKEFNGRRNAIED